MDGGKGTPGSGWLATLDVGVVAAWCSPPAASGLRSLQQGPHGVLQRFAVPFHEPAVSGGQLTH